MRSSLKYCYNNGTVKVSDYDSYDYWCGAGGIVGMSFTDNTISYCYNTSSVSGGGAGGIIGNAWDDTISYCYSTGIINGNDSCGGIAGTISLSEMTYIKYCYANQSPLYGSEYNANFMSIISVAYKSSTAMKTLSNLSGFSSSDWAVDAEVNNGYPYLRSLEDTYRIYEVTIVEEPENSDMLSKCFANVDGILYGESAYEGGGPYPLFYISAGGILGFAEGDDKANASNLIAVADRVSSAATKIKPYSGDIVGRIDDDAMDFRSVYSYSSMSKSAVNTTTGAEGYVVETGTPRTITNIQRASFLRTVFGPETYQSLDYLDEHPDAVWVVKDGEFPELYYNVLNDITVSESENGTVSVDKAQAVDGEIVTVTALPNENYVLNKVYVNGNEIDGTTFEVSGDSNVFVTFAEKTPEYDIKVTSSENAEASLLNVDAQQAGDEIMLMSGTDSLTAKDGEEIRVDTEASEDHTVDAVYVNGETLAGDSFIVTADSDITMEVTSISTERKAVTNDAVDVGNYFATLSGSIEGDNETTERYIRYWAADEPDMVYTTEAGPGSGAYSIEVTNLRPETEYKYQMTETGEIKSFVTKSYYTEGSGDEPDVTPSVPVEICFEISDMRVDNGVVCADIANTADSESSGKIILAAYGEDDTLISAELSEIDKMPVGESVSCEFTAVENAVKYKLMIWDSTDKMAPLAESAEVIL